MKRRVRPILETIHEDEKSNDIKSKNIRSTRSNSFLHTNGISLNGYSLIPINNNHVVSKCIIDNNSYTYNITSSNNRYMKVHIHKQTRGDIDDDNIYNEYYLSKVSTLPSSSPSRSRSHSSPRISYINFNNTSNKRSKTSRPSSPVFVDYENASEVTRHFTILTRAPTFEPMYGFNMPEDCSLITLNAISLRVQQNHYATIESLKEDILIALDGLLMFTPMGTPSRVQAENLYTFYTGLKDILPKTHSIGCLFLFTKPFDQQPMVDAITKRLARRGGRVPNWYPTSWKRNARKACRYYYNELEEDDVEEESEEDGEEVEIESQESDD